MKKFLALLMTFVLTFSFILTPVALGDDNSENGKADYNIFMTLGTLPTLYAGLVAFQQDTPSYMWFSRKETFDTAYLPDHVELVSQEKRFALAVGDMAAKVKQLYTANPESTFNLYVDDLRVQLILQLFVANGVPESNYHVHLMSDGTATYSYFNNSNFPNGYADWEKYAKDYEDKYSRIANGETNVIDPEEHMAMFRSMYYASQKDNVEYWMQFPELLRSNDPMIVEEMKKMNMVKISPYDIYNTLPDQSKNAFLRAAGIDKDFFDQLFHVSDKPNLIISGTSLAGERNTFEAVVQKIAADYSGTYDLFFKPHPAWNPETNEQLKQLKRKEFLDSLNIKLLPAQLPMETLMWAYPDVKIGGYSSTLYMSTAPEQTVFFIADGKSTLAEPLPELYDLGHFGHGTFYKITRGEIPDPVGSSATMKDMQITAGSATIPASTVSQSVYSATVSNYIDSLQLTVTASHDHDTVTVNQGAIKVSKVDGKYVTDPISLNVGDNYIEIAISNSSLINYYSLTVTRQEPSGPPVVIPTPQPPAENETEVTIPTTQSGTAKLADGSVVVEIPAGASDEELRISIKRLTDTSGLVTDNDNLLSSIYEILKNIKGNFNKPVKISLKFDPTKLDENQKASIFYYDEDAQSWIELGGTAEDGVISVEVDHFTKFAVFAVDEEAEEIQFTDIQGHWAEQFINQAVELQIVQGYGDNTFKPDQTVTREEFIAMLVRAMHLNGESQPLTFVDHDTISNWAREAVSIAVQNNIVQGYDDNTVRPKATITRAELATMVGRAFEMNSSTATSFDDDANIPSWAKGYVAELASQGIVQGRGLNRFVPHGETTRAEVVAILVRALNNYLTE